MGKPNENNVGYGPVLSSDVIDCGAEGRAQEWEMITPHTPPTSSANKRNQNNVMERIRTQKGKPHFMR